MAAVGLLPLQSKAQDDPDISALLVANQMPDVVEKASNWRIFSEAAAGGGVLRSNSSTQQSQRLSFDVQYDGTLAQGWRAILSDRLDINWPAQIPGQNSINTVKEAYLIWQMQNDILLDAGRINVRNGVATGYNPTDFFRNGALRSIVSADPSSLKEDRQGSVMLRAQKLWDGGSVTALFSPKLAEQANNASFSLDIGATNSQNRWLVALSQKMAEGWAPQFLLFKSEQLPTQIGMNLTTLVNDATVAYVEWSGGRSPSLLAQAYQQQGLYFPDTSAFRNRTSVGLTYTTENKISVTTELEYNGGALDQNKWDALQRGPLAIYGQYRNYLQTVQEAPTARAIFVYASWQDALLNHLDLSAMSRFDAVDSSRMSWLEARFHFSHAEFALQWQRNSGNRLSDYGVATKMQSWQLMARYFF
ncbi:hypothetical protein [Undibacterium sp. RuRC25W]|uniref:hypothetical protein n=1 Tax=Undibacterium sp. RuRC25W TaxID=3413047 RepID=UPI003BF2484F